MEVLAASAFSQACLEYVAIVGAQAVMEVPAAAAYFQVQLESVAAAAAFLQVQLESIAAAVARAVTEVPAAAAFLQA